MRGDLSQVADGFRCRRCDGTIQEVDLAEDLMVDGETYECVKSFCYLGDTLDGDGGEDLAATARIRNGWMKFRELLPFLTSRAPPLEMKGRVYASCVRSSMTYGSETRPLLVDVGLKSERAGMQMIRWMCGISLKDRRTNEELRKLVGVEPITTFIRSGRLRWYGHVMRKGDEDWVKKCMEYRAEGRRSGSKRHSLQAVELSQWTQAAVQIVSNLPAPSSGGPIYRFLGMQTGWLALLLTKAGDVETIPGPTTLNKKVWICDICQKQIHVRNQISIRCNRIEHWVHLRCAGIRQAQYTDTWTCHLHRESRLTQT